MTPLKSWDPEDVSTVNYAFKHTEDRLEIEFDDGRTVCVEIENETVSVLAYANPDSPAVGEEIDTPVIVRIPKVGQAFHDPI